MLLLRFRYTHSHTGLHTHTHRWRAKNHIHFRNFIALHLIFNALTMCEYILRVSMCALCVRVCPVCGLTLFLIRICKMRTTFLAVS